MFVESDSETNTQERSVSSASIFITSSTIRGKKLNPCVAFFFDSALMQDEKAASDTIRTKLFCKVLQKNSISVLVCMFLFIGWRQDTSLDFLLQNELMLLSRTALWSHLIGTDSWSSINKSLRCWVSSTKIISLCRRIWKLPWFPLQKVFGIYQLDFGLLKKISSVIHSHIDELHRWWGKKRLELRYKQLRLLLWLHRHR